MSGILRPPPARAVAARHLNTEKTKASSRVKPVFNNNATAYAVFLSAYYFTLY
jgi:hypothetical protein